MGSMNRRKKITPTSTPPKILYAASYAVQFWLHLYTASTIWNTQCHYFGLRSNSIYNTLPKSEKYAGGHFAKNYLSRLLHFLIFIAITCDEDQDNAWKHHHIPFFPMALIAFTFSGRVNLIFHTLQGKVMAALLWLWDTFCKGFTLGGSPVSLKDPYPRPRQQT